MSILFGGAKPTAPPPIPTIDDAVKQRNSEDQSLVKRGRATTVLTSDAGLPNLGSTAKPAAGGQ